MQQDYLAMTLQHKIDKISKIIPLEHTNNMRQDHQTITLQHKTNIRDNTA